MFHERSFTPRSNSSLSSRRPSFSAASNFGGSPTFIDRTISTQRVLNSPFYNGRTIYGGAAAYGRKLGRSSSELRTNLNNSVEVKPKQGGGCGENMVLSKTARRILDTLEQYTTPVNDAKKIPVVTKKSGNVKHEGLLAKYTGANPYKRVASNTELHVPTVPELLKMKQQLQESTEAVRQIATNSKSNLNKEEYRLPLETMNTVKHSSKIKTKVCTVRQKVNQDVATVEEVKLPAVVLPISTLPKFDFSVPPPTTTTTTNIITTTQQNKTDKKLSSNTSTEFKFSDPLIITENIESIIGMNNYKFSEPILKKQLKNNFKINDCVDFKPKRVQRNNGEIQPATSLVSGSVMDVLGKAPSTPNLFEKFKPPEGTWECSVCLVRNQADKTKCVACETAKVATSTPQSTSLLEKFKPAEGSWECSVCLVRNQADKNKCIACETPSTQLMQKFKPAEGTWECSVCLVRNQPDKTKCIACESLKTTKKLPKSQEMELKSSNPPIKFGFGEQFKPAKNTWECSSCMVRNQMEAEKCVACESLNPETKKQLNTPGFGIEFKKKSNDWECESCMVKNSAEKLKCVCCETPKPGSNCLDDKKSGFTKFSFGVDKQATSKFTFGIKAAAVPPVLPSQNTGNSSFVFGSSDTTAKPAVIVAPTTTATTTFTFGITPKTTNQEIETKKLETQPKEQEKIETKTSVETPKTILAPSLPTIPTNLFNTTKSETKPFDTTIKPQFTFNASNKNDSSEPPPAKMPMFSQKTTEQEKTITKTNVIGGFSFGSNNENKSTSGTSFQFSASTVPQTQNGFNFGASSTTGGTAAAAAATATTGGFSFGKVAATTPAGVFNFGSSNNSQVSYYEI